LIDPPSIVAAQQFLAAQLPNLPNDEKASDSQFGPTLRKAFLMLTCTVTGLNSLPPPAPPAPLLAPVTPFK
jgi:hypothetical protein